MREYTNSEFANWVSEHIHSERDRKILIDRFVNGLTFGELEERHHISERQIKRIVHRADSFFIETSAK